MAGEIVLINIADVDRPGLMAMVTSTLAEYQARVLDLGQAVIHDTLGLGFLVQLESAAQVAALQQQLAKVLAEIDLPVRFTPISPGRYSEWQQGQGKPRYILTLMSRGFAAEQLAAVSIITRDAGLNIETVRRLSGRLPLSALAETNPRTCIEMVLRGVLPADQDHDAGELKAQLLDAAARLDFDFSVQQDTVYRRNRRLVAFDMDSTLIQVEAMDELAKRHGVGDKVVEITARAMAGELDFNASFRERANLLAGHGVVHAQVSGHGEHVGKAHAATGHKQNAHGHHAHLAHANVQRRALGRILSSMGTGRAVPEHAQRKHSRE